MPIPFRQDRSPVEKPGPSSRTCRAWMPGKRQAGWPSLWVTFLLATQEKSDSAADGGRKPAAGEHDYGSYPIVAWTHSRRRIGRRRISNPASTHPSPQSSPPAGEEAEAYGIPHNAWSRSPFRPNCDNGTRPFFTSTPSARNSRDCSRNPRLPTGIAICPLDRNTRYQGSTMPSGTSPSRRPTRRARPGKPARAAIAP